MTEAAATADSGKTLPEPQQKPGLSDIMLAMDVVDTLRHRQSLVDRELNAEAREAALIEKVKAIYASQGIEVTDAIIAEGVQALEEKRFSYSPPQPGLKTRLARIYVDRGRWFKRLLGVIAVGIFIWGLHFGFVALPEQRARAGLVAAMDELDELRSQVDQIARIESAKALAGQLAADGKIAADDGHRAAAAQAQEELNRLLLQLRQEYTVRIISRPGESSGVWRIPPNNEQARNYYLIVEGVNRNGRAVAVQITSEEDQITKSVRKWGIRVAESLFNQVRRDKEDDGIIQMAVVGEKRRGYLDPDYRVDTTGASITEW